jgi:hypothetical protein
MKERERNKRLLLLIQKLRYDNDNDSLELLETMVNNDTDAMKKTFSIMLKSTPIPKINVSDPNAPWNWKKGADEM